MAIKEGLTTLHFLGNTSVLFLISLRNYYLPIQMLAVGKFIPPGAKGEYTVTVVFGSYPENNSLNYIHFV